MPECLHQGDVTVGVGRNPRGFWKKWCSQNMDSHSIFLTVLSIDDPIVAARAKIEFPHSSSFPTLSLLARLCMQA